MFFFDFLNLQILPPDLVPPRSAPQLKDSEHMQGLQETYVSGVRKGSGRAFFVDSLVIFDRGCTGSGAVRLRSQSCKMYCLVCLNLRGDVSL